jgi:hypothetical protein
MKERASALVKVPSSDRDSGLPQTMPSHEEEAPMDRQRVGIDLHRRRSVIVRLDGSGERLGLHRIVNDPGDLAAVIALCGDAPAVRRT